MKKVILFTFVLLLYGIAYGQMIQANYQSPLSDLQKAGWKIHSHSLSFDKQVVVFSAAQPKQQGYDLYVARKSGDTWGNVTALVDINTSADELYPTLSSNERDLIYVRHNTEDGKGRKKVDVYYLMYTHCHQSQWSSPEVIIVSEGKDISPMIFADGKTVIFASARVDKNKKESNFGLFFTRKIDERNWYNPILIHAPANKNEHYYAPYVERYINDGDKRTITIAYTHQVCSNRDTTYRKEQIVLPEQFHPEPVLTLEGRITDVHTRQACPAEVNVYNAVNFKPLAQIKNAESGVYKVALPYGVPYFIDITGENYSHDYSEYDCTSLLADKRVKTDVVLDKQLNIRINAFDDDILLPISPDEIICNGGSVNRSTNHTDFYLQIGNIYDITYKKKGYEDTTLHINTQNSILLTHSELDVEMRPSKTKVALQFVDADSLYAVRSIVDLRNQNKDEDLLPLTQDSTCYNINLRQGDTYHLYARAKGYVYKDTVLHIPYQDELVTYTIPMFALREEMVLQLRNIQFDHNSYALTKYSYSELDKLVKLMQDNPSMQIELSAHTDDVGSDGYNLRLSQRRGESAMKYLLRNGISPDRIVAKGYGKTKPLVPNTSDENRAINRRVEFTINAIQ
jgi:outer membrane protein OmpA-like peptidoglycan-associated protein